MDFFFYSYFSICLGKTAPLRRKRELFPSQLRAGDSLGEDFAAPHTVGRSSVVIGVKGRGAERPSFVL